RVRLCLRDQLGDDRVADVGLDEVHPLEPGSRRTLVHAGDVVDLRIGLEPASDLRAEEAPHSRDEDAAWAHLSSWACEMKLFASAYASAWPAAASRSRRAALRSPAARCGSP